MGSDFFSQSETWVSSVNGIREDPDDETSLEEGEGIGSDSDFDESVQMGAKKRMMMKKRNQVLLEGFVEDEDDLMRTKSLTDEDLDELKGCVDLGFGFSYDEIPELCNTLPALELCYSMSQKYMDDHQKSPESSPASAVPADSCSSVSSPIANWKISSPGDHPEDVKARLKFWAQAVACTVRLCN
ncbi:hypothetical protein IC582_017262 [Cucumis melo]|uniref:Uncharacterized protein LOC103494552 n=2 Tax=Cucumis melo TaxID=3656 RepID=A0A1S3BXQ6_CUCME|nr:uncharacterized protein LOC103494552 [Cucumis melo]KAA0044579.1 uncharacterized protein E6C27_scaffold46G003290 [Cucumis melo var. makuwa]